MSRLTGKIKWFDHQKGYGFIVGDDGNDYFLHYTGVLSGRDGNKDVIIRRNPDAENPAFVSFEPNDVVEFSLIDAERGPQAVDLELKEMAPVERRQRKPKNGKTNNKKEK